MREKERWEQLGQGLVGGGWRGHFVVGRDFVLCGSVSTVRWSERKRQRNSSTCTMPVMAARARPPPTTSSKDEIPVTHEARMTKVKGDAYVTCTAEQLCCECAAACAVGSWLSGGGGRLLEDDGH